MLHITVTYMGCFFECPYCCDDGGDRVFDISHEEYCSKYVYCQKHPCCQQCGVSCVCGGDAISPDCSTRDCFIDFCSRCRRPILPCCKGTLADLSHEYVVYEENGTGKWMCLRCGIKSTKKGIR